ncbi:hypothetical protein BCM27_15965 [Gordonia terrae]|nr:hypothetical protein BCM27_15965 [Gordonia terrae]
MLQVFRTFAPRLRPVRWWLLAGLTLSVIPALIAVAKIALFERLVDDVLVPADLGPFASIAGIYIALNLLAAVIDGADDYLGTWISQRFLTTLRRDAFAHVLALPSHRLDHLRLGDVMSRLTSDIGTVESFMVRHLTWGFRQSATLVVYVIALMWMDLWLALASMVVVPLFSWAAIRFADFTKSASRERRRAGSLGAITEEHLANAALVQGLNQEPTAIERYERQNLAIMDAELVASRVRALFLPLVGLFELLGVLVVIGLGVWALAAGRMTLGEVLAFLALLGSCFRPVRDLGNLLPSLFAATAGIERVQELLDEPALTDPPHALDLPADAAGASLRQVHARYPGRDSDAVRDLELTIAPGERVAVTGGSGAGKTTLTRLLDGSLQPRSDQFCWTTTILPSPHAAPSAPRSPSSPRRCCCPTRPSRRTSRSPDPTPPRPRSPKPLDAPMPTTSSVGSRTVTTHASDSVAAPSPVDNANDSTWPVDSSAAAGSSSSTSRPPASTEPLAPLAFGKRTATWDAFDTGRRTRCILKVIRRHRCHDEEVAESVRREGHVLADLAHRIWCAATGCCRRTNRAWWVSRCRPSPAPPSTQRSRTVRSAPTMCCSWVCSCRRHFTICTVTTGSTWM